MEIFAGIMIPFAGTALGSACVFFLKNEIKPWLQKLLLGFASGIMVAASVWSLLIPSVDMSEFMGVFAFVPAAVGFFLGILFLLGMDHLILHIHPGNGEPEGTKSRLRKATMLVLAVTLHNIPEGMAVGAAFAGMAAQNAEITLAGAMALSFGIAIQNFPEGAVISMPLKSEKGMGKGKAFIYGTLSGTVEPLGAVLTFWLFRYINPALPYLLAFAAGAMIYVVVEELIPETGEGEHSDIGTIGFAAGFILMMVLDIALG